MTKIFKVCYKCGKIKLASLHEDDGLTYKDLEMTQMGWNARGPNGTRVRGKFRCISCKEESKFKTEIEELGTKAIPDIIDKIKSTGVFTVNSELDYIKRSKLHFVQVNVLLKDYKKVYTKFQDIGQLTSRLNYFFVKGIHIFNVNGLHVQLVPIQETDNEYKFNFITAEQLKEALTQ